MKVLDRGYPVVDLPSRDQVQRAISKYWAGGGRASVIVDVLRREGATLSESEAVAERLALRVDRGNGFVDHEVVAENLELHRAAQAVKASRVAAAAPEWDTFKCIFARDTKCPQCSSYGEPIIHGELIAPRALQAVVRGR